MDLDGTERQYRVLSVNGNVCKVLGMWDDFTSIWNTSYTITTTMGSLSVAKYEGSTIDTYLNTTWYNTLTDTVKAAIVPESVVCDAWYRSSSTTSGDPVYSGTYGNSVPGTGNYSIGKYAGGTLNIGERNVFALGVQDVIDYLNDSTVQVDTTAILRNVNIWKMFWNDEVSHSGKYPWLRSSYARNSSGAWSVGSADGDLDSNGVTGSGVVRPALNLDMSKIQFTVDPPVTEGETWYLNETLPTPDSDFSFNINFVSNNHSYTAINWNSDVTNYAYKKPSSEGGGGQTVYSVIGWIDSAYRTITLEQPATGDLLTWLQSNAVKQ